MNATEQKFTAAVEPPLRLANAREANWADEADVVIVGFGGAGVSAALEATCGGRERPGRGSIRGWRRNRDERRRHLRGRNASPARGGLRRLRGRDVPLPRVRGHAGPRRDAAPLLRGEQRRRRVARKAWRTLRLDGVYGKRIAYPPEGYFLYYSGMEKFRDIAKPIPRGHRTYGKGPTGRFLFPPLRAAALEAGVRLLTHAPARRLVVDAAGRVVGIEVQALSDDQHAAHQAIFRKVNPYKMLNGRPAEAAVVECREFEKTCTGRAASAARARRRDTGRGWLQLQPRAVRALRPIVRKAYPELVRGGTMGCDGSGIELGVSAGGGLSHMERMFVTKGISPPEPYVAGVLVNAEGRRFITEDAYLGNVGCAVAEQPNEGAAWLVLDSPTFWKGVRELLWPLRNAVSWWGLPALLNITLGGTRRAPRSAAARRASCEIDPANLEATVRGYNASAARTRTRSTASSRAHLRAMSAAALLRVEHVAA